MSDSSMSSAAVQREGFVFDLLRGIAAFTASPLVQDLARTAGDHPAAALDHAFNHKQVACKLWLRDALLETLGPRHGRVWILGGWYAVLAAMLLDDRRLSFDEIVSIDLDPDCAPVALTLNRRHAREDRFRAQTADMYALDYAPGEAAADIIINTSCEHIPDLPAWLARLGPGRTVVLQSNDYFDEPEHVAAVADLEAFIAQAGLSTMHYAGSLPQKNYTRFMLIGQT